MPQVRTPLDGSSTALYGAGAGMIFGLIIFGYGLLKIVGGSHLPMLLSIAISFTGFAMGTLSFFVMNRSRLAWAFACSLSGVGAVILLLAAPKIRDVMDFHISLALAPSLAFAAILFLLFLGAPDF